MYLIIVGFCLVATVGLYFYNNPLSHGSWFLIRRFINWFPLGMTYAFLYMGRYNLTVSKNALGGLMSNEDFGLIFAAGTIVYGCSFLVNGPLIDKIGGKKGIIIAALGASLANILLGVLTFLVVTQRLKMKMLPAFSIIYALNMYFQSYGAVSIIKVKAYWFHVRERGVFGAIFGTLISFGVYFAFDWGQAIIDMTKAHPDKPLGWLQNLIHGAFAMEARPIDATWAVFFIPAAILVVWSLLDVWLIKDTPEEADFPPFDTHDASSGQMHIELTTMDLLKKVFASRLMLLIAFIGLTAGVLRNGVMNWYIIFAHEVKQTGAEFFPAHWGLLLCIFGIVGGFAGGLISDKFFHSRRGPPAALLCAIMFVLTIVMTVFLSSPIVVGLTALLITTAVIGVHSLMSGTAAADFGGRKATATCSGIVDGFVYLGTGLQSVCTGYLTNHHNWRWWPIFLVPFTLLGLFLALKIWHELPAATKKYIAQVEQKSGLEMVAE
ncbi:Glycerol-3-phosphate transporter [Verrucomicrobia bacterium]|nr:Glycerol-3-phosphate transporter [Verrucomicrobiota bacterium]